jgi:hypothetical protein
VAAPKGCRTGQTREERRRIKIRPGCSIGVAVRQLEIPPVWANSSRTVDAAVWASNGRGQQHVALDGVALTVRNSHQIRPHLPAPLAGRAAHNHRERYLAKECVGSNRVGKERSQLPVATTTETNPENETTVRTQDTLRRTHQKNKGLTPGAGGMQQPGEKPFPLDKLFQERSETPRSMRPTRAS